MQREDPHMETDELLRGINRRLGVIIALLAERAGSEETVPVATLVERLDALGLSASEIAVIIRRQSNHVSAILSRLRKRSRKKKEGRT